MNSTFVLPGRSVLHQRLVACFLIAYGCLGSGLATDAAEPVAATGTVVSERTLVIALDISRDDARLLGFTVKNRPYRSTPLRESTADESGHREDVPVLPGVRLEIALAGQNDREYLRHVDLGTLLCLDHASGAEPHIEGDTTRLHRDSIIVELPEVRGFDEITVSRLGSVGKANGTYDEQANAGNDAPVILGKTRLRAERFTQAGGASRYADLLIATGSSPAEATITGASGVLWPESFGDTDLVRIYGNAAAGAERVNVTIVPDGYTYAQKELMETHANDLVAAFRARSPFTEHDEFINYTLIYAYSGESGTDQCDCDIIVDTAMGTRFPTGNENCGSSANRCLYYGAQCDASDTSGTSNIVAAELRAPFHDETIVMVNTPRYGGCGGLRSVYSAGNGSATEVAIHELGHSLAGLADEYAGNDSCGSGAGEINTSADAVDGAWPEWLEELGAPVEGAQYYDLCRYRPMDRCQMRSLSNEFCPVCRQHWGRVLLGHPRVQPTAPLRALVPGPQVEGFIGYPLNLSVETRLPGPGATNLIDWYIATPPDAEPVLAASETPDFSTTFAASGDHRVTARVVADAEAIKPVRWDVNVDTGQFDVTIVDPVVPAEVSPVGAIDPLIFVDKHRMVFGEAAPGIQQHYNIYGGPLSSVAGGGYGTCLASGLAMASYADPVVPPVHTAAFYLVTAANPVGEGPLGVRTDGLPRSPLTPCR